jgi:DNA-binding response OmpR family regulator
MAKILVVDDEDDIVQLIERYAKREGYEVETAGDGNEAIEACRQNDYDAIIMDVMMPDTDGFTACKKIHTFKDIPVIMLSARGTEYDKLFGFEVGVDDYVTKPFSPKELMARINVVIRRHTDNNKGYSEGAEASSDPAFNSVKDRFLEGNGIKVDLLGHNVYVDDEKQELTAKEYAILVYLMENKGIVLTRDQILNKVWGYDYFGDDRTVDWQIKLLRNKLGSRREAVHTIRGTGYKFEP